MWRRGAVALVLCACLGAPVAAGAERARESIEIAGMTFVSADPTGRRWAVWADHARYAAGDDIADLTGVTIRFQDGDDRVQLTVRCVTARVAISSESFRLDGEVRGVDATGRHFATDWLEFDGATGVLSTSAAVELNDDDAAYRAGGLRYEVETRRLLLLDGAWMQRQGGR